MSTSLGPIATHSMRSLLAAAIRLILTGLSTIRDLPTVTVSLETMLGEDSAGFCAETASRAHSTMKATVCVRDPHNLGTYLPSRLFFIRTSLPFGALACMWEASVGSGFNFRAARFREKFTAAAKAPLSTLR